MNTPLDLEPSRAIFETVGWYETEKYWERTMGQVSSEWRLNDRKNCYLKDMEYVPAPTFGEVLRQVNVLASTLKTDPHDLAHSLTDLFWNASTEKEGMRAVGDYLNTLLK